MSVTTSQRHVAAVTTSRADFGHLHWPLKKIAAHPHLRASLIVAGAHASPEFGHTLDDIRAQGFAPCDVIECLLSSDSDVGMAKTIGLATLSLADTLGRLRPDLILLPADRYEMLAVASVALALRIPVAHIEGGEISAGAIDDAVRNALTKLSHLHLTPTADASRRVRAMGEEKWRVHQTGAPSLDHLRERTPMSRAEAGAALGTALSDDYLLVSFHPVTLLAITDKESRALYEALAQQQRQIVFCFPNADAGSRALVARARDFCSQRDNATLFVNLEHWLYWNVLRHATVLLGNSSSGIMEAPSLRIPVVNIGHRQEGRTRAGNIIDSRADADDIGAALATAASAGFRASLENLENPYGDGRASERIVRVLANAPDRATLLLKKALPLAPDGTTFVDDVDTANGLD